MAVTLTQLQTLKADFDALAAKFDALMATFGQSENIIPSDHKPLTIEGAKAKARADLEARIKARVAELTANKATRLWHNSNYIPARQYLDQVHAEQARIEQERRNIKKPSKFQCICNEVRKQFPNMPDAEVYIAARMRIKLKQHTLPQPTPFERACADAKQLQPHLQGDALFAEARRLIKARRVIPAAA